MASEIEADLEQVHEAAAIGFVLSLARALHRFGTPAHRLEEALTVVAKPLGLDAEVFSTPTTIIVSFGAPAELRTRMLRVETGAMDMAKLAQVDALANQVMAGTISPAAGQQRLDAIIAAPATYGRALTVIAHAVSAGALAVFFAGTSDDVLAAAIIGFLLGLLGLRMNRSSEQARVYELIGAAIAAFLAVGAASFRPVTPSLVTVASLIVLLPGMSLTVAMTELATRNLISGNARLMSAVIVLLQLAVGVAIGEHAAHAIFATSHAHAHSLPAWSQWAALVSASIAMAVVVQAEARALGWILVACIIAFVGTHVGTHFLGGQLGVLVGALGLGVLGNFYARVLNRPAQVVLVPATLLLVPGSMGFRGMTSLLDKQTLSGVDTVFAMFVVAISIVAGLLIANAVLSPRRVL